MKRRPKLSKPSRTETLADKAGAIGGEIAINSRRVAGNSHALELDEQGLVRIIPTSIDALEPVAEANHNVPILKQVAQGRCWWVGRIAGSRELHDHAIEERDDDFAISPRVVRTAGERGRQ